MDQVQLFLRQWTKWARIAFWGNAAFANDWQWLLGVPALSAIVGGLAAWRGASEMTTGYPIFDGVITGGFVFAITWFVAFVVRLLNVPVVECAQQAATLSHLQAPPPRLRYTRSDLDRRGAELNAISAMLDAINADFAAVSSPLSARIMLPQAEADRYVAQIVSLRDNINSIAPRLRETARHLEYDDLKAMVSGWHLPGEPVSYLNAWRETVDHLAWVPGHENPLPMRSQATWAIFQNAMAAIPNWVEEKRNEIAAARQEHASAEIIS